MSSTTTKLDDYLKSHPPADRPAASWLTTFRTWLLTSVHVAVPITASPIATSAILRTLGHATYRIWLKKPNYARVEATAVDNPDRSGILVGDEVTITLDVEFVKA